MPDAVPRIKFIDPDFRSCGRTNFVCCKCQRDVGEWARPHRMIYLRNDGANALHPDDVAAHALAGDVGWVVIGSDCARQVGMEWSVEPTRTDVATAKNRPRFRQVRSDEVAVGATYHVDEWTVRLIGPLHIDPSNGGSRVTPCEGSKVRKGWWVVTGPSGPMRVQTRDLRVPIAPPDTTGEG